jgi:hypothetical protein
VGIARFVTCVVLFFSSPTPDCFLGIAAFETLKALAPEWSKAATELKGMVKVPTSHHLTFHSTARCESRTALRCPLLSKKGWSFGRNCE